MVGKLLLRRIVTLGIESRPTMDNMKERKFQTTSIIRILSEQ
jgi:hypothetical protein